MHIDRMLWALLLVAVLPGLLAEASDPAFAKRKRHPASAEAQAAPAGIMGGDPGQLPTQAEIDAAHATVQDATNSMKTFLSGDAEMSFDSLVEQWDWITNDIQEGWDMLSNNYPKLSGSLTELQAVDGEVAAQQAAVQKVRDELTPKWEALIATARERKDETAAGQMQGELSDGKQWIQDAEDAFTKGRKDVADAIAAVQAWQAKKDQVGQLGIDYDAEVEAALKELEKNAADPNAPAGWMDAAGGRQDVMFDKSDDYKQLGEKMVADIDEWRVLVEELRGQISLARQGEEEWRGQIDERTREASE